MMFWGKDFPLVFFPWFKKTERGERGRQDNNFSPEVRGLTVSLATPEGRGLCVGQGAEERQEV